MSYPDPKALHTWDHRMWPLYWYRVHVCARCIQGHTHMHEHPYMCTHTLVNTYSTGRDSDEVTATLRFLSKWHVSGSRESSLTWKTGVCHTVWGVWGWDWNSKDHRANGQWDAKQSLRSRGKAGWPRSAGNPRSTWNWLGTQMRCGFGRCHRGISSRTLANKRISGPFYSPREHVASGFPIYFSQNLPWSSVLVKIRTQQIVALKEKLIGNNVKNHTKSVVELFPMNICAH